MTKTSIYVLSLQGGRYYVGKSDDVPKRYQQHVNGSGSAWTRKYKPVSLVKTIENASSFDEDKVTKEYMSKYGIDKVRGGSYVEVELSDLQKESIQTEIWSAKDLCTKCGRSGHFVKDCHAKTYVSGSEIEIEEDEWGCEYCDRTFTTAFGAGVHEKWCKEKNTKTRYVKETSSKKGGACYRCGNTSHYSPDCYATRDVHGRTLDSDSDEYDDDYDEKEENVRNMMRRK